ncbi:hypothetical protein [Ornithinimicrobium faecis]|uniref:Uncharacterized protein n=1 Tax=Ornithinimicrobium faecis TaxID=2934158 RepID=A0ABY4YY41_9MICO|nr:MULTISPECIES: hypothetical protein [unclassified Ornithinimicrobium]USQ81670.1 hypothetical protein NF556_08495 [Ornithinimicrobium sp. HY1793]
MTGAAGVSEQVEREARQLVEAATRWLSAVPDDSAGPGNTEYAARTGDLDTDAEASAGFGAGGVSAEGPLGQEDQTREDEHKQEREHAEEHLCRGCPWCRAKAAAGPIGADTLDSLAHLLSTAAESLSLFAQSRREASHDPGPETDPAPPEAGAAHSAADAGPAGAVIDWDDEDEDELRAGEDDQPKQSPTKERRAR